MKTLDDISQAAFEDELQKYGAISRKAAIGALSVGGAGLFGGALTAKTILKKMKGRKIFKRMNLWQKFKVSDAGLKPAEIARKYKIHGTKVVERGPGFIPTAFAKTRQAVDDVIKRINDRPPNYYVD